MKPNRQPNTSGLEDYRNKRMQEVHNQLRHAIKDHQEGKTNPKSKHKKMSVNGITKLAGLKSRNWQDTAYHQDIIETIERWNNNLDLKHEGQVRLKQPKTAELRDQVNQLREDKKELQSDLEALRSKIAIYQKEKEKFEELYHHELKKNSRLVKSMKKQDKISPFRKK